MKTTSSSVSVALVALLCSSLLWLSSSCSDSTYSDEGNTESSSATGSGESIDDDRPDLILVSIDAFRADRSSIYGYEQPTTPTLERLAAESLVFERAYTTMPLALPAHASMLTGLVPAEHGVRDDQECALDSPHKTLSASLAKSGYRTGAFVGSLDLHVKFGLNRGFDRYDDSIERMVKLGNDPSARPGAEVVERAVEWLSESSKVPAFLFINLSEPDARHAGLVGADGAFDDPYDTRLAAADAILGSLISRLEELGRFEPSYLLVTSGSGEGLGAHGETGHGYLLHDSTLRVPLLLKTPGSSAVSRVASPASLVDIPATLLAAADAAPLVTAGVDLVQLADNPQPDRAVYAESLLPTRYQRAPHFALIAGTWKYIHSSKAALYDLASDPGELENVIEAERARATELNSQLSAIRGQRALTGNAPGEFVDEHELIETLPGLLNRGANAQVLDVCDQIEAEHERLVVTDYYRMLAELNVIASGSAEARIEELKEFLTNNPIRKRPVTGKLDPYPSAAAFELGFRLVSEGRGSEAIYPLKDALRSRPYEVVGHLAIGESFVRLDRTKAALKAFGTAVNIESTADLQNTLGILRSEEGDQDKSHQHFVNAVALDPDKSLYQANIARSYAARFEWEEAFAAFRRSLELAPFQAELELEFAYHLATVNDNSLRDVDAALEAVANALKQGLPESPATLEGVAAIYAEVGAYDLSIKFAERALELAKSEGDSKQAARIMDLLGTYRFEAEAVVE